MSNVKSMGKIDELDKLVRQNPHGIKITQAARKLGISRSYAYKLLESLDLKGKAHYEKGTAYPCSRSTEEKVTSKPSRLNFWTYRKWKRQYEDKRLDKNIRELQCERDIYHEKFEIYKKMPREKRNDPLPVDVEAQLRKKWRKFHDLE